MAVGLKFLDDATRLLFEIPLKPLQGNRFQPTGFPSLGAATFQTRGGTSLLVESAQSVANFLEMTIWDAAARDVKDEFKGLSHVRVTRNGGFLTDTIIESHRLNSPYLLGGKKDRTFFNRLKKDIGVMETGPLVRRKLAEALTKYDINSLLHGVFLEKLDGRLRVARALSGFIEADDVQLAPSGGVKNDHINPSGITKDGFGNVPFARDEYTAKSITLYVNLDLAQIRGYGLGNAIERLLILLALYKLRALADQGMRLRTACDLHVEQESIEATMPGGWLLPGLNDLKEDITVAISECKDRMVVTEVTFEDELKKGKAQGGAGTDDTVEAESDTE